MKSWPTGGALFGRGLGWRANAPINVKPVGGGGKEAGHRIDRFGPGVGHLNYLAVPEVGILGFLFVPVTTNHFPCWGLAVIFDLTFLPGVGNFTAIL